MLNASSTCLNKNNLFFSFPDQHLKTYSTSGSNRILKLYHQDLHQIENSEFSLILLLEGSAICTSNEEIFCFHSKEFVMSCYPIDLVSATGYLKGIQIIISHDTFKLAFDELLEEGRLAISGFNLHYFQYPNFFSNVHDLYSSPFFDELKEVLQTRDSYEDVINNDWYKKLAKKIIIAESKFFLALQNLNQIKKIDTRKDLLRRILKAKNYIDAYFIKNPSVKEIASQSNLSFFHFCRLFKLAFEITPHRYLMNKRINHAQNLINVSNCKLKEIALSCNFPDVFTFSKAYKKIYGYSPTKHPVKVA